MAKVKLVDQLGAEDRYDLVVVAMQKDSPVAGCTILAESEPLKNVGRQVTATRTLRAANAPQPTCSGSFPHAPPR